MTFVNRKTAIYVFIFFLAGLLWLWGINDPYVGLYNTNNNYLSLAAKNFLRFGFANLHFLPTYFSSYPLPTHVDFYLNHPPLFFLLAALPYLVFGFQNWVVHVSTGLCTIGIMYFIYRIGTHLWGKKIGLWSLFIACFFPMTGFFWKFMFFEQITLFFNLWILYLFLVYRKKPNVKILAVTALVSFLCMQSDWYGIYLLFVFPFFLLLLPKRKETFHIFLAYGLSVAVSLSFFIFTLIRAKGTFFNLQSAVSIRTFSSELFSLSYPWVRLSLLILIRIAVYFTPISLVVLVYGLYTCLKNITGRIVQTGRKRRMAEGHVFLLGFGVLGLVNIIFLPTATWGHAYFLFYLIPFFAFAQAIFLIKIFPHRKTFLVFVMGIILTSVLVQYLKVMQVKKQLWKYSVAEMINTKLDSYEPISVSNFPGDVVENYFLHPTVPISFMLWKEWFLKDPSQSTRFLLLTCSGDCSSGELYEMEKMKAYTVVFPYRIGYNRAWLVKRKQNGIFFEQNSNIPPPKPSQDEKDRVGPAIYWYRTVRDFLGVGQL